MISSKVELEAVLASYNFDYALLDGKIILVPTFDNLANRECYYYYLKLTAIINQDRTCICGSHQLDDLHHALLSRADVRGLRKESKSLIHHSLNVIAICRACHEHITKDKSLQFLSDLYGISNIRSWYYSIPLKCHPRQI